jgi:alpha-tubulin suppressor-like RCC1 family protein
MTLVFRIFGGLNESHHLNFGQVSETPLGPFVQIAAGDYHNCGLTEDGEVECWGLEETGLSGEDVIQVACGDFDVTCILLSDGSIDCWEWDDIAYPIPEEQFEQVAIGRNHVCGVKTDGYVECWGSDSAGMSTPPDETFQFVDGGDSHSCGIKTNGHVECWGSDYYGQSTPP